MKEKGFTLIELLAVIVILAIIALIATPIILNIINDSRVESKKRSAENYLDAVEQAVIRRNMDGEFKPTTCAVSGKTLNCEGYEKPLEVDVDGEVPISGTITFSDNKISDINLNYNGYSIAMDENKKLVYNDSEGTTGGSNTSNYKTYANGEVVYFDVENGVACLDTDYRADNSLNGYNGLNGTENQTSCLKFYAFLDDGGANLNLLLDHNVISVGQPNLQTLDTATNGWSDKLITPDNYSVNIYGQLYEIDYSNSKARYIEAQEIAQIVGVGEEWNEQWSSEGFNLNNSSWLYDNITNNSCAQGSCFGNDTTGYFTANSVINYPGWSVGFESFKIAENFPSMYIFAYELYGIRPVIEVPKSNL